MKRISIIILFTTLLITVVFPQSQLHIKDQPQKSSSELVAVRDANGNYCAALKILSDKEGFKYESYNGVVKVKDNPGEDIVYLSADERVLQVYKTGYQSKKIILSEIGIQLEEKAVWEIKITGEEKITEVPVVITVNQNGAEVLIDGKSVGKINDGMLTDNIGTGDHTIKIQKEGYATQQVEENISLNNNSFNFKLEEQMPAVVSIKTEPEGAKVYIDGLLFGTTPVDNFYDEGTYPIRIVKDNYETVEENITITEPETKKTYNLKDIRATLTIKTDPNAMVRLNGKSYQGGIDNLKLLPQTISFSIVQKYCETIDTSYTLTKSENKIFELYPEDISATLTINTHQNASVKFNGKSYKGGVSNLKITPQVLKVEVDMPKAEPLERSITLRKNGSQTVKMYPDIKTGSIQVITIPTNAKIELNGDASEHYTATGRKTFSDVPIGEYELVVQADGYKTLKEVINLEKNGTVRKQITLEEGLDVPEYMVLVEGGTFRMGDVWGDGNDRETPTHEVTISSFYISKYEVTQEQYRVVMGTNPSYFSGDNRPVENVSWWDAIKFCNKLSEKEGLTPCYKIDKKIFRDKVECDFSANGYRLPTEAEWEYTARSGGRDDRKWSGTNSESDLDNYCWYQDNNDTETKPVGTKEPNDFGIYDMSGNVWEWCWDWYGIGYYSNSPTYNPTGTTSGSSRVVRGGSWGNTANRCRTAIRGNPYPFRSDGGIGFRLTRNQ